MSEKKAKAERKAERARGWKIDVRAYKVRVPDIDENGMIRMKGGRPVMIQDEFDVQGSLCDILFNRELQVKPQDAFKAHDLAEKIRAARSIVVLDSEEMGMVRKAYDALKGVTENMIEFLSRIRDAEEIGLGEVDGETDN
uniref:Uncharacterized protein n=1 Tax=viral metagenome TaxID=1070528 RepID=A0A6M3J7R1_9ZZZZ